MLLYILNHHHLYIIQNNTFICIAIFIYYVVISSYMQEKEAKIMKLGKNIIMRFTEFL